MTFEKTFLVMGNARGLVLQVLLTLRAYVSANCMAMCSSAGSSLRFSRLISEYFEIDFSGVDDDRFAATVNRLVEAAPELMLIPTDCESARMVMRVRGRLKARIFPIPDATMLDRLEDKWHFYQFCKECDLDTPPTLFFNDKHDIRFAAVALEVGRPFVVKPLDQAGSKGIVVISSEEDYRQKILDNDSYCYKPLIVQRYVKGTDVGLDVLAIKGRVAAMAMQRRHHPQDEPARISFFRNDYLEKVAHIVATETAYDGVMNIDARIEEGTGKVYLFECNPRFWRSVLASTWCGLNFVEAAIEPPPPGSIRMLTSGCADTFYHPLFRPAQWRYALFDHGHRGRIVRSMLTDICVLGSSIAFKANAIRSRA